MFHKTLFAFFLSFVFFNIQAFAGTEDWDGHFIIQLGENIENVFHSAHKVSFMFFSSGKCIHLTKGSKINGYEMPNDFHICTDTNIPKFTQEVQGIGNIVSNEISAGDTYHD